MRSIKELAWLGGLLEGEGYFFPKRGKYPAISLNMTDRDSVEKVAIIFGTKTKGPYGGIKENHKFTWRTEISGSQAAGWMMTLFQFFCKRRGLTIKSILKIWRNSEARIKGSSPALCHPGKIHVAKGLCEACYMRELRARGPMRHRFVGTSIPWLKRHHNSLPEVI